ncbi:RecQ family ATP-dependent DNA helicase [Herbiconiux ginsengi]|uniref:ATP-dependent DNA helicase RecQ n=1 Tax=Herbiconiux ginsengi TaxID=381665 RepID=A0A1H3LTM3_9MICO|nr:RecQ family ATP-dependent DNA helicase [Herbiconiux ginsengi]SDY67696.1 ATP-dependent DNA helicase RecQ [Herbiconiux ginsengi]
MSEVRGDDIAEVARRVFGWAELRAGQEEAVAAVVGGADVLAVMATGYGKSAIYQLAGHLLDGPTVVVSPLISLQVDQVRHIAESTGRTDAVAVNSGQSKSRNDAAWTAVANGEAEFLFLAPEQLARDEVIDELTTLGVGLVVVDEAHCVSAWGHDFRPDYLRLGGTIERLGGPRILALTATGSAPVREEIVRRLGMRDPRIFVRGFDRPNVHLAVVRHESAHEKDRAVLAQVSAAAKPGLVYVATRGETGRMAGELKAAGLRAAAYHGGLGSREHREVHGLFQSDRLDAVVATSAFGMGIDKPDVRFVVHADITDSIDSYYQEVGRAGRDGEPATATLHYRQEDLGLRRFFAGGAPDGGHVDAVVRSLASRDGAGGAVDDGGAGGAADGAGAGGAADDGRAGTAVDRSADGVERMPHGLPELARATGLSDHTVGTVVNLLIEAGLAAERAEGIALLREVTPEQTRSAVAEAADHRLQIEESRLAMVRAYAETLGCRRQFLLAYFGDELAEPCGNCDTCESGTAYLRHPGASALAESAAAASGFHEGQRVRHAAWGDGEVVRVEPDRLTVFFETKGYRVLSLDAVTEGGLLA